MSACAQASPGYDICATPDQITGELISLLPQGRAWGTHDGGPFPGSISYLFWYAVATVLSWFEAAVCAMVLEFFCATTVQKRDDWMADYNLPDGCDPFPDLCTKVSALGGTRCDYYTAICAQAGWSIQCLDTLNVCGTWAGSGTALAGCCIAGQGRAAAQMFILVSLSNSPAYSGGAATPSLAGRMQAGFQLVCPPDLTGIQCLLARIVGGHKQISYGTTA